MSNHNIKYQFTKLRYEYVLPLTGVTIEFINERREEIQYCTDQVKHKIVMIDITSKEGVAEFSIANHLVNYYFKAWCLLDYAESELIYGKRKEDSNLAIKAKSRRD